MSSSELVGRILGHYRLLEQIGQGGMGVVFRARDERLQRDVAVKILPPGMLDDASRRRFRGEALAMSALNHPNIATVHDFDCVDGVDYLVTEFIPGQTLDDKIAATPMPEKQVVELGAQMAEGLATAHAQGITHRDLKPGNLRVTPEGRLKILDFGLAQLQPVPDAATVTAVDAAGGVGTLPYMAPEQLRGEKGDVRSDLWSAGTVLYEAATGKAPFIGRTASALAGEILHAQPVAPRQVRPALSAKLEDVILKCLEKEPENRYQSAKELLVDLRRLSSASSTTSTVPPIGPRAARAVRLLWAAAAMTFLLLATGLLAYVYLRPKPIRSVAVLPFVNSGDASNEYISDGITEELINSLTQVAEMKVIARPTAFSYKGRQISPQQVGRELGVSAVVLGRLMQSGNQITVQVDIIDTSDGSEIWGGQLRRAATEVQSIQQDIVLQVSDKLRLKLSGQKAERLARRTTQNSEAYERYLRGRFCIAQVSTAKLRECVQLFQQATKLDPEYAQAWAGLADAYAYLGVFDLEPPIQVVLKARETANRALQIDETVAEAHTSLAIVKLFFDWDFRGGEAELRRALELNPGDIFGRHIHAHYLEITGQMPQAHAEMRKIMELDPVSTMYTADVASEYYFMHQPEKVVELSRRWTGMDSMDSLGWIMLALAYEDLGKKKESVELVERVLAGDDSANTSGYAGMLLGRLGQTARAKEILANLKRRSTTEYVPPFALAMVSFGLGDDAQAFTYLKQAYEQHSPMIMFELLLDPQFDRYRSDPRYLELARHYNVPVKAGAPTN
jgi:eukaryotic-like serine/threonine-protein kinase